MVEAIDEAKKAILAVYDPLIEWSRVQNYLGKALLKAKSLFLARSEGLFGASYMDSLPEDQL